VLDYPDRARMQAHVERVREYKVARDGAAASRGLDALARAAQGNDNVMGRIVEAADAGATHGEICATLHRELGFGRPLTIV